MSASRAGARLQRGRLFDEVDARFDRPVAVVSVSTARRFWGEAEPLGRSLVSAEDPAPLEVIGVVEDPVEVATLGEPRARRVSEPIVYSPLGPEPLRKADRVVLVVEGFDDASALIAEVDRAAREVAPGVALSGAGTISERDRAGRIQGEVATVFNGLLGLLSAALGAMGLYAAIAHAVARRRPELGIRVALGASPSDVRWMVLRRGLLLALAGIALGVPAALATTRLFASEIAALPALDVSVLASTAALILGASLLACYVPARGATEVDPAVTLRSS